MKLKEFGLNDINFICTDIFYRAESLIVLNNCMKFNNFIALVSVFRKYILLANI